MKIGPECAKSQDGDDRFRGHRHQNADPVTLLDSECTQSTGQLHRGSTQLVERHLAFFAIVSFPVNGDSVAITSIDPAIERVVDIVEPSIDKPLRPHGSPGEINWA